MYRWRLLAYKYGDNEQRPSNFEGHAIAIRLNSSNQKIEFVDRFDRVDLLKFFAIKFFVLLHKESQ